jgi:hypothetical protein
MRASSPCPRITCALCHDRAFASRKVGPGAVGRLGGAGPRCCVFMSANSIWTLYQDAHVALGRQGPKVSNTVAKTGEQGSLLLRPHSRFTVSIQLQGASAALAGYKEETKNSKCHRQAATPTETGPPEKTLHRSYTSINLPHCSVQRLSAYEYERR